MPKANTPADVFKYIDTHDNDPSVCWEWIGSTGGRDGRGYISINYKKRLAYIVVRELFFGPMPEGMVHRHTCDNPLCCNPTHIIPGTRGDNENDKYDRDRAGYTLAMLKTIRRHAKLGMTYQQIADAVNQEHGTTISASGVGKVIRGDRRVRQKHD